MGNDPLHRWRFNLESDEESFAGLSVHEAFECAAEIENGTLSALADGECVQCEFNATHASVLFMGRDRVILRPFFPARPAEAQDLAPFYCSCCGILEGPMDEYLARFFDRQDGLLLFRRVLMGPSLPRVWPETDAAEIHTNTALEWIPLPRAV